MSATITYKGNTIATASNNTKVLKTAGKYMEDDVTITDVTQGGSTIEPLTVTVEQGYDVTIYFAGIDTSSGFGSIMLTTSEQTFEFSITHSETLMCSVDPLLGFVQDDGSNNYVADVESGVSMYTVFVEIV